MTASERMKALRDRKIAQGFRQVLVWIPERRVDELRAIARAMREEDNADPRKAPAKD